VIQTPTVMADTATLIAFSANIVDQHFSWLTVLACVLREPSTVCHQNDSQHGPKCRSHCWLICRELHTTVPQHV